MTRIHGRSYAPAADESREGAKLRLIYVVRYLLVALYTLFWGSIGVLAGLVDRKGDSLNWITRTWTSWILKTCGVRVQVEGLEQIDRRRSYLFMSNHQSVVDIAVLVTSIPVSFRFVAKRELRWIPFFGWALAVAGHILIDRSNRSNAIRSLEAAAVRIRNGVNVIVFPEGTRSRSGELQSFKRGGFHLAIAAQVPVIPVTVSGSQQITPKRSLRIESGTVKILYGKPIPTEGLVKEDRNALMEQVRAAIQAGYDPSFQEPAA